MTTNGIATKAMLARLSISQWSGRIEDKRVTREVAERHNVERDAGRYGKILVARQALRAVTTVAAAARNVHYQQTLPWSDEGFRILPAANYWKYRDLMADAKREFETEAESFCAIYPQLREDARAILGDLYRIEDYPESERIAERFSFATKIGPLPDAADFRVAISDEEAARIKSEIETDTKAAIQATVADLWERVHGAVSHMAERLRAYGAEDPATGRVQGVFRDSLVANVREVAELLPRLNVTGDSALAAVADRLISDLCGAEAETLRQDAALRESTADAAERLLADMAGYAGAAKAA